MRRVWRLSAFEDLKREWEQRLKDDGFQDIEVEKRGERHLKRYADAPVHDSKLEPEQVALREAYFDLLRDWCLKEMAFEDASDRIIMERTAAGAQIWEISKELRELGYRKSNRDTIRYVRRRYETKWGIRIWRQADMVSRKPKSKS